MSVIKPEIDTLLERTEHNPFLLCSVASITPVASGKDSVSIAMGEIADGTLGFVQDDFDEAIRGENAGIQ